MNEFGYLLRGAAPAIDGEQMQRTMDKWGAWLKELSEKGHLRVAEAAIEPIEESGRVAGYVVIEAASFALAVELATSCPILESGGFVEVRPVQKVGS